MGCRQGTCPAGRLGDHTGSPKITWAEELIMYDAYETRDGESERDSKELREANRKWTPRSRCEIRGVAAAPE